MNNLAACFAGGLIATAILEFSGAPADWLGAAQALRAAPDQVRAVQAVDRSAKGDRLPVFSIPSSAAVRERTRLPQQEGRDTNPAAPGSERKLPVACEPVISPIIRSPLSQRIGRCVT